MLNTGLSQSKELREKEKELKANLSKSDRNNVSKDYRYIPSGRFKSGTTISGLIPTKNDTTLLFWPEPKQVKVDSFFIASKEVTNNMYRQFVNWTFDSIRRIILAEHYPELLNEKLLIDWSLELSEEAKGDTLLKQLYYPDNERFYVRKELMTHKWKFTFPLGEKLVTVPVYPDTNCWTREMPYEYGEPMNNMYFWHPAYDNYPVVGISWLQAQAFCYWITKHGNTYRAQNGITYKINYRLPSEEEWEYAALSLRDRQDSISRNIFPWFGNKLINKDKKFMANYGESVDANNFLVKVYDDDNSYRTSNVGSYSPNYFGLYNMAGNVAEWTSSTPHKQTKLEIKEEVKVVQSNNGVLDAVYISSEDEKKEAEKNKALKRNKQIERDNAIIERYRDPKIVKGGSWADSQIYMICGLKEVFPQTQPSSRIGFRMVMEVVEVEK